jgi:type II secretory pathway pseudopilin PulG
MILDRRGLTLIELVTIIPILAILTAISIPNYARYKQKAEHASIQIAIRMLASGQELYYAEHGSYFPAAGNVDVPSRVYRNLPELEYTFPEDHLHRYLIYTLSDPATDAPAQRYYIIVYSDLDLDNDGSNDVIIEYMDSRTTVTGEEDTLTDTTTQQDEKQNKRLWRFDGVKPKKGKKNKRP